MNELPRNLRLTLYGIFVLAALIVVADFALPGVTLQHEITQVKRKRQQYQNAARNYHYSYTVVAGEHEFSVAEDFAKSFAEHDEIEYSISRIFKEVNWYRSPSSASKSFYSLRMVTGLVIPLLALLSLLVAYRIKRNIDTLVLVLQALLIADVGFLLIT